MKTRLRRPGIAGLIVLAAVLAILALSPGRNATATVVLQQDIAGTSGCEPSRPHDAGGFARTIESGGLTREYMLHVPDAYSGSESTPLLLNLHGLGSNAGQQAGYSELPAKADEDGFLLLTPQGTSTEFLPSRHWNFLTGIPESPDDVMFIDDLLNELESELCVDRTRIYSTGISNGAMMSVRLACELSHRIAAIGAVAGLYYPPWSPDLAIEPGCESLRPVPVIAFHGTADGIVPYQGGPLGIFELVFDLSHIEEEVLVAWAEHNSCATGPATEQVTEHVARVFYGDCSAGAAVELYRLDGGGHLWPGADDIPPPDVNDEVLANDLMWEFFESHAIVFVAGDADCDGSVNSVDASVVLQGVAGLLESPVCLHNGDVNGDGTLDSRDAALLLQHDAGLLLEFPV